MNKLLIMEWKIGEIRQIENNWYQCIKGESCSKCDFLKTHCRNNPEIKCTVNSREDGESVIFKKLDRIIGPIIIKNRTFQKFASYSPSCTNCVFNDSDKVCRKKDYIDGICDGNGFWVEIKENIERKIGKVFNYNGEWYQCLNELKCTKCDLLQNRRCIARHNDIGFCSDYERKDHTPVIFKRLEKIGEPFDRNGYMYQEYKTHTYPLLMSGGAKIPTPNGFAVIIKNKEDMKTVKISKDDLSFLVDKIRYGILPKHIDYDKITNEISKLFSIDDVEDSNSENIGKNLKPFNLEAAKSGKPVCTRDGEKARIICFDRKDIKPIVALITSINGDNINEKAFYYFEDGHHLSKNYDDINDLMMLPEKKEGWANIYKSGECYNVGDFSFSKEEIEQHKNQNNYIATVKISWEE